MNKIVGLGFFCVLVVVVTGTALIENAIAKCVQSSVTNWLISIMQWLASQSATR